MKSAAICLCLLTIAWPCLADGTRSYRFSKEIKADVHSQDELIAVPLDSAVYATTRDNLADLRILDSHGATVPYVRRELNEMRPQTNRENWPARDTALQPLGGGSLEIKIGLGERDPQPSGLTIVTPLQDFEQRVRVFGVDDHGEQPLVAETRIFDYSQYMDVRRLDVRLPPSTHRRFRIVIEGLTADQQSPILEQLRRTRNGKETEREERTVVARRPFRIERIEFFKETIRQSVRRAVEREYPVDRVETRTDADKRRTIVEISTQRQPLTGFRLQTPSRNFSRRVTVEVYDKEAGRRGDWREIGSGTVSRIQLQDWSQEELKIAFAEHRGEKFRLLVDDRDSPQLDISAVVGLGRVSELVFLATSGENYRVVYGDAEAESPEYDTAAIRTAIDRDLKPLAAALGPEVAAANVEAPPLTFRNLVNHPVFLTGLIAVLVPMLGWGLYRASRRIENLPPQN